MIFSSSVRQKQIHFRIARKQNVNCENRICQVSDNKLQINMLTKLLVISHCPSLSICLSVCLSLSPVNIKTAATTTIVEHHYSQVKIYLYSADVCTQYTQSIYE